MVLMRVQYDASGPIILASDFPVFRDNLKAYLEQETDIEIIGCASSEQESDSTTAIVRTETRRIGPEPGVGSALRFTSSDPHHLFCPLIGYGRWPGQQPGDPVDTAGGAWSRALVHDTGTADEEHSYGAGRRFLG